MSEKSKMPRNLAYVASYTILSKIITISGSIYLLRTLSPYDFGIVALCTILTSAFKIFENFGINTALVKRKNNTRIDYESAFMMKLAIGIIFTFFIYLIAPWWALWYEEPDLSILLRVLSIYFVVSPFLLVPNAKMYRALDYKKRMYPNLLRPLVWASISSFLAFNGYGYWSLIYGTIISETIRVIAFNFVSPWKIGFGVSRKSVSELFSFGKWVFLSGIFFYSYNFIDSVIISKFLSITVLAYYSVAYRWAHLLTDNIRSIYIEVLFPTLSKNQKDETFIRTGFLDSVKYVSLIIYPIAFGIISIADVFVNVVIGAKWAPSILPLQILAISGLARGLMLGGPIFYVKSKPEYSTYTVALNAFILAILVYTFVLWKGMIGVCFAVAISFSFMTILQYIIVSKMINLSLAKIFKKMLIPLFSSIIMALSTIWMKAQIINTYTTITFLFMVILSVVIYIVLIHLLSRGKLMHDTKKIFFE